MASRSPSSIEWALVAGAVMVAGCARPTPSPFSRAETDQALAPARDLRQRCYVGTRFERERQRLTLEFRLNVAADGRVRSVPTWIEPEDPELVECVRHRLDELRFPVRGRDHVDVHFELGPDPAVGIEPRRDVQLGTCEPACTDGFSCHYEPQAPRGVCRVTPGRCRFQRDCAPSQACQRLAEPLGVCIERSP